MAKLITDGRPHYGIVREPFTEINYRDFDLRTPLGRRRGKLAKTLGYNHFQYFGIISQELIAGCALVNMRLGVVIFCYVFEPKTGRMVEWQFKDIGWLATKTVNTPTAGTSAFNRGKTSIRCENTHAPRTKRLVVSIPGALEIDATFSETDPVFEPMCITTKTGANGWVYAQKVAGVRCRGRVQCALASYDLEAIDAFAHHDWSGGYMRRETFWNWACLSGSAGGARLGLNVSCGVNETEFTENCFWVDGKLHKVDAVQFAYDRQNPASEWHITSYDGQIDLRFTPKGRHEEVQNFLVIASNFKQFFGEFRGRIGSHQIDGLLGFVEDQYAKW